MEPEKQRARYLVGSDGAPPVPPPGGYQGARRVQVPLVPSTVEPAASVDQPKQPANVTGRIALIVSILFAVTLVVTLMAGGTNLLYGVSMLTLQLIIVAVVIAALFSARGRMLGAIALAVTVLFNVATVGGVSAVVTSATGTYQGTKTKEQLHQAAYPGIKDEDPQRILAQPSLEDVRTASESLLKDIRSRLSEEFGYTWVKVRDESLRPERNGYGGESMLEELHTAGWATNEPIHDYDRKLAIMRVIDEVVVEHRLFDLFAFNDPQNAVTAPSVLEKFYGSTDPRTQHSWEYYSDNFPLPSRFYADIYDLTKDKTGGFLKAREAQRARTGEPLEGLQITMIASAVLSEADRDEFIDRLKDY